MPLESQLSLRIRRHYPIIIIIFLCSFVTHAARYVSEWLSLTLVLQFNKSTFFLFMFFISLICVHLASCVCVCERTCDTTTAPTLFVFRFLWYSTWRSNRYAPRTTRSIHGWTSVGEIQYNHWHQESQFPMPVCMCVALDICTSLTHIGFIHAPVGRYQRQAEHIRHSHANAWWFTRLVLLYVKQCSTSSTTTTMTAAWRHLDFH